MAVSDIKNETKAPVDTINGVNTEKKRRFWMRLDFILFAIAVFLAVTAYIVVAAVRTESKAWKLFNQPAAENIEPDTLGKAVRNIDGVLVEPGQENKPPLAVMIDNHSDAWPQAGLASANLVYEAEVEGRITRYMAVFASDAEVEQIGPVRSARPYFVDWADEISALYTHVGGSPEALVKMKKENSYHINEFYDQYSFWRSPNGRAPHNVFTSTAKLRAYIEENNRGEVKYFPWLYKDDAGTADRADGQIIKINYRLIGYKVEWHYLSESNSYDRFLGATAHQDAAGNTINAKNIIIQTIPAEEMDSELRLSMDVTGTGKAIVCRDGRCEEGTWQKKSASARTRYYDNSSNEFEFNRGTTWIEVVRPEIVLEY